MTTHLLALPDGSSFSTLGAIVMDESTSMRRFGATPLSALEGYLDDLRGSPDAATTAATIVTFSDAPRVRLPPTRVVSTPRFLEWSPTRGTRLYGSVYDVLASLLAHRGAFRGAVVSVLTDGEDNGSSDRRRRALVVLAGEARALGWELLTFGIGVDARAIAQAMGFPDDPAHARTVAAEARAVADSIRCTTQVTSVVAATMRPPR